MILAIAENRYNITIIAKDKTAETIWFSVSDETNIPIDMNAAPSKTRPTMFPKIKSQSGEEIADTITAKTSVIKTPRAYTKNAAKNLPMTIAPSDTGAVSRH